MATDLALFIAQAQGQGSSIVGLIIPFVLMFVIMYFLMIKPQQKKQREHDDMIKRLKVGDEIVTTGGVYGVISAVNDESFKVKIADNCTVKITRGSIAVNLSESEGKDAAKKG